MYLDIENIMRFIFIFILLIIIVNAQDLIYERIPKYNVGYFIQGFFEQNGIYDCFKKKIDNHLIYLKCIKERKIVDIIISIHGNNEENSVFV